MEHFSLAEVKLAISQAILDHDNNVLSGAADADFSPINLRRDIFKSLDDLANEKYGKLEDAG